jgi:hypothetical protein
MAVVNQMIGSQQAGMENSILLINDVLVPGKIEPLSRFCQFPKTSTAN